MRMINKNDKWEWQIRMTNENYKWKWQIRMTNWNDKLDWWMKNEKWESNDMIVNVNIFYDLILLSFLILLIHLLYETFY